ncbi:MAG: hypothetical protein HDR88_18170 [Bacteroides sp.]|nr:hypothetical protein [Bacteroides sp.]
MMAVPQRTSGGGTSPSRRLTFSERSSMPSWVRLPPSVLGAVLLPLSVSMSVP